MLNAKINSTQRVTRKEKIVFSALIAPVGAASFLKEGYFVSGCAIATQYTERLKGLLKNVKLNCVQYILSLILLLSTSCGTKVFNNSVSIRFPDKNEAKGIVAVFDNSMGTDREWILKQGKLLDGSEKLTLSYKTLKTVMAFDSSLPEKITFGLFLQPVNENGFYVLEIMGVESRENTTKAIFVPFYGKTNSDAKPLLSKYDISKMSDGWKIDLVILQN